MIDIFTILFNFIIIVFVFNFASLQMHLKLSMHQKPQFAHLFVKLTRHRDIKRLFCNLWIKLPLLLP